MDYFALLERLHTVVRPAVYLEIGVFTGESLALSSSRTIAIDPSPRLRPDALAGKPWLKLFRQPSDEFFATHRADEILAGNSLDLVFIDGLHEFAQVVRDLEHVEQWSHPGTVVVVHDVLPRGAWQATRAAREVQWTGDVWRLVPFLAAHRPELKCRLVAAEPTGVLIVTGLGLDDRPMSRLAADLDLDFPPDGEEYDRLVADFLARARPESPEAFLRSFAIPSRQVAHHLEAIGWLRGPGELGFRPAPDISDSVLSLRIDEPLARAYRIDLEIAASELEVLRIALRQSDGSSEHDRSVWLDIARPGALYHKIERVGLAYDATRQTFILEMEGLLPPGEHLRGITFRPASREMIDVPPSRHATIDLSRIRVQRSASPTATVRFAPDDIAGQTRNTGRSGRPRDAVVFAWHVPQQTPELGDYYLNLLRYRHADSKLFIGMNHGSDPAWERALRESGLDVAIRWARPEIEDYWDTTGFLTALGAIAETEEAFSLVWFGHTKGGSRASFAEYRATHFALDGHFWARRDQIARMFANSKIGIFAPRFSPLPAGFYGEELPSLLRVYRDDFAPIGLHAKETFFVMRGEIVRRFCRVVGPDFFHTSPGDYGASRYFFEIGFPNIASMQGFVPFIDHDVAGANSPRDDVWLTFDPKQNHRLARIEVERWQRDPFSFTARPLPEVWEPAASA